ncbi:L-histidine N(alpha)-methyltransferase [Taibaiella koreensis]|uniref:L-histidine N(alpha)-methyltransferase n=1 Tax=Taibaiella koreensis TaxID=1268548 RepID=UPI001F0976FD|nr:L-histidine N(alpha)-methyltransferase [Taibaiella koreensis]
MKSTIAQDKSYMTIPDSNFRRDVIRGLSARQKYLEPKYFYDATGDRLFQQIMQSPEYYLTNAELEILQRQSNAILGSCLQFHRQFDIVELGAGDASKSLYLLEQALQRGISYHYYPIDISGNVIGYLETSLPGKLPGMTTRGFTGEYFHMLEELNRYSKGPKLVLFLGATIGNMQPEEAFHFCRELHTYLNEGDLLLIGFDLKKDPATILAAYNDAAGITRDFNLNLLARINRELEGNFDLKKFRHYPVYDPGTGACKSYLISTEAQVVTLGDTRISFEKDEAIYMEVSQKYDMGQIEQMARKSGFTPIQHFYDRERNFLDTLWTVPSLKSVLGSR